MGRTLLLAILVGVGVGIGVGEGGVASRVRIRGGVGVRSKEEGEGMGALLFRGGQSSGRDLDFGGIRERERISHVMRKSSARCVMCDVRRVWMSKQFESTNGISNVKRTFIAHGREIQGLNACSRSHRSNGT